MAAVVGDDARRLLAAMLQGVQAERGQGRGVLVAEDAEDAAFLAQAVVVAERGTGHRRRCASPVVERKRSWRPLRVHDARSATPALPCVTQASGLAGPPAI